LISDLHICKRFCDCLKEAPGTYKEKSIKLNANEKYLIQLQKKKKPTIKASIIANFCVEYQYNPIYILTGKGSKKLVYTRTTEEKLINHNEQLIETIRDLLGALIELNVQFNNPKQELIQQAKKRIKS
jgi:hypothetical protein